MTREPLTRETIELVEELFLKYEGRQHERIEKEVRAAGHRFNRSMLYTTKYGPRVVEGLIEKYGLREKLPPEKRDFNRKSNGGRNKFEHWLRETYPEWNWSWRYQRMIYKKLEAMRNGGGRLMIFLPPRHGKSELVTVRYIAWRLLNDPKLNVIIGSYNQRLANKFSRKVRRIARSADTLVGIGDAKRKEADKSVRAPVDVLSSAAEWETGGGGVVRAAGVGAGIAGFGAGLIVIDDPIRNRADAESEVFRDNVWDWFNDDVYTRLEPKASIILIQTRWHEDDLAGRLLAEMNDGGEKWDVLSLPAIAEDDDPPELKRLPGDALCPKRYDIQALERIRRKLGGYSFAALYQQRPAPAEGGVFKREWFRKIVDTPPEGLRWKRGYDLAVSTKQSADYTASFRCAKDEHGNLYIADGYRARIEFPEQRKYAIERMQSERRTEHGIEAALHGAAFVQDLRRDVRLGSIAFRKVRVDTDKLTRALPWLNLAEEGKVILVRGAWNDDFIEEVAAFPAGRHDDQIDAVSIAVAMLAKPSGTFFAF